MSVGSNHAFVCCSWGKEGGSRDGLNRELWLRILGLQPRDKAAMLVVNKKEIFLLNLHQNRVHFPAERNAFVLDHQHGRRDVTCKPAIRQRVRYKTAGSNY